MKVLLEMQFVDGEDLWVEVCSISRGDPTGSISSYLASGGPRDVYLFGIDVDGRPGVWRSILGLDVADTKVRAVSTLGLERLSDLAGPYPLTLKRPAGPCNIRFRRVP